MNSESLGHAGRNVDAAPKVSFGRRTGIIAKIAGNRNALRRTPRVTLGRSFEAQDRKQGSRRFGQRQGRVAPKQRGNLFELLDHAEGEVDEDVSPPAEFALSAAAAAEPFLADHVTHLASQRQQALKHFDGMHPSFSKSPFRGGFAGRIITPRADGGQFVSSIPRKRGQEACQHLDTSTKKNPMSRADAQPLSPEARIAALEEQLAAAQKMTALGELVSTTTHEFNNVLMTILNYARMGLRHKDEPTRDKALQKILDAGQRAAKITSSILAMARNRSGELEPTDLAKLIDESLVLLERELSKYRISVELQIAAVPEAMASGNQIQQVLLNLLINARQAMPSGGRVTIKLEHDKAAGTVDLTVRDTGSGIPADKLPRIFDRFFTTKSGPDESGKGGTGLGLSTCKSIIDAHHGRIRVQSTVGKGTAFLIKLPVAKAAAPLPAAVPAISSQLSLAPPAPVHP